MMQVFNSTLAVLLVAVISASSGMALGGESHSRPSSTAGDLETEGDPHGLKQRTRVVVTTNFTSSGETSSTNAASKTLEWHANWKKWDGLHFELRRRTLLGQEVVRVTNLPTLHLEEIRMSGKIGIKLAVDGAAYLTQDSLGEFDKGVEVRRARVYAKGDCLFLLPVSYELEVGFVPGSFFIENSYLAFHDLGVMGTLQVGQFQVPMSLVNYGSSRDMMFMESATPLQALAPGVNAGFQVGRPVARQRMTWALGLFTDSVGYDFGDATRGFGRAVGRVTGLPLYVHSPEVPEKQHLLHLGASGSLLYAGDSTVRYQSRPESHLAPVVVDTGDISAEGAYIGGLEAAWVNGPLCVQAEYLHSWVQGGESSNTQFHGGYVSAGWMITGESRPYNRSKGIFGHLVPRKNFNPGNGGWGAWEVAGRLSYLDLNGGRVEGGRVDMVMLGVHWYLNPSLKWRFNYGFGDVSGRTPEGDLNVFQTRFEVAF